METINEFNSSEAKPLSPVAKTSGFSRFLRKWSLQIAISLVAILIWAFFLWRSPATFMSI